MLVVSSWYFNQIIYLFFFKLLQYSRQEPCRLIAQLASPSVSNGDVHASNPLPSTIKSSKIVNNLALVLTGVQLRLQNFPRWHVFYDMAHSSVGVSCSSIDVALDGDYHGNNCLIMFFCWNFSCLWTIPSYMSFCWFHLLICMQTCTILLLISSSFSLSF